jgi:hypothetical protein
MPNKYGTPAKVKTVVFLTHVERGVAEQLAQSEQLTLSEWLRQLVVIRLAQGVDLKAPPPIERLPQAKTLRDDFIFGDINDDDPTKDVG